MTPKVRRTQEQRRTEAESRLLDAARTIVARTGWAGMTLAEVGATAGYSRSLAAHHFGTKSNLLRALTAHIGRTFLSSFSATLESGEGFPAILRFIEAYLGRRETQWTNTRALLILMAEGTTDNSDGAAVLSAYNKRSFEYLRLLFEKGVSNGEIRKDIDASAAAVLLLGSLRGIMLQSLQKESVVNLSKVRQETVSSFIRAFAARPEPWLTPRSRRRS